jgi:enamine deaminase RidA (YjgF/YER057c/UK114 family)
MSIKRYGIEGARGSGGQHLPFARAVEADGWLYVSGQVAMVNGEVVGANVVTQSQQAISNLLSILKEAGYGSEHVVRCGVWPAIFRRSMQYSENTLAIIHRRAHASFRAWSSIAKWRSTASHTRRPQLAPRNDEGHTYSHQ